jgi:hypothetical protein
VCQVFSEPDAQTTWSSGSYDGRTDQEVTSKRRMAEVLEWETASVALREESQRAVQPRDRRQNSTRNRTNNNVLLLPATPPGADQLARLLGFRLAFRDRARAAALEALVAILFRSSALRDLARALPPCRANSIRAFFKTSSSITQILHLASKMARAHPDSA